jgi:hypothetical protein
MTQHPKKWFRSLASVTAAVGFAVTPAAAQSPRPGALLPLYASYGTLQGLDVNSTLKARAAGAVEANPLLAGAVRSTPALVVTKSATTAAVIFAAERLRRSHPKGAVILMVCANAALAGVVAHNYAVARTDR